MTEDKYVYILLTDTGTFFTRLIKLYTRKPLNHVSIAFDADLTEMYSFGRKKPNNPFIGGFIKEDKHSALLRQAMCAVYRCKVSAESYEEMYQKVKHFNADQAKYKYNLIGLLGVLFNRGINRKYAFFCSQFVAMILANGGKVVVDKEPALVRPYDFVESDQLDVVYKGELGHFLSPLQ